MLGEKESFEAWDGHDGTNHAGLPAMAVFPSEIDWRRVGIALTEEAFALRVDLAAAQEEIRFLYEINPPDGGDLMVKTQTVGFGLRVIDPARSMRSRGGLPTASSAKRDYSAERYLLERRAHFDEVQRTALAAQERSRRELAAPSAPAPSPEGARERDGPGAQSGAFASAPRPA